MLPQLRVLLILFAAFISVFIIVRKLLVPDTFGEFGHYRGDALVENEDKELKYSGTQICIDCHDDVYTMLQSDMHQGLSCEVCHGPGFKHADSMEPSDISKISSREDCGRCHGYDPARPADVIVQVDLAEHYIEKERCIDCHNPHMVWELKE